MMDKSMTLLKLKICFECPYHQIKEDGKEGVSYFRKEDYYSVHTKCIANQALQRFLSEERINEGALKVTRKSGEDQLNDSARSS